jgi:hypothetical protein
VGAVLAAQHDEWAESRRYLGLDVLSKSRPTTDTPTEQEATLPELRIKLPSRIWHDYSS